MSRNLHDLLVGSIADRPDANLAPVPVPNSGPMDTGPIASGPVNEIQPVDSKPVDWGQALEAATARLDESWVRPDFTGQMLALGLADELAATLCAYGMVTEELVHMHERAYDREAK